MKKYLFLACAAALFGMTGCGDDGDGNNDGNGDKTCTARCEGNMAYSCDANNVEHSMECPNGCDDATKTCKTNADQPVGTKCTADVCNGNNLMVCNTATGVATAQTCPNGCDAATNKCKDAATDPGAKCTADVCDGNNLMVCNTATGVATAQTCPNGCDAATNKCKDAATDPGAKCTADVCDGNNLMVCNKTTGVATAKACANGCDATKNACKDGGSTNPGEFKVNEVPASQNNTKGAPCTESFVDHCDGTKVIYCNYASEADYNANKLTVLEYECSDLDVEEGGEKYEFTCGITLTEDKLNYAECIGKTDEDLCEDDEVGLGMQLCQEDEDGYEMQTTYGCFQFNDGKNHVILLDEEYCSNICADGCKQEACNTAEESICSEDKGYAKDCWEMVDGSMMYLAYACSPYEMVCSVSDGYADCE